MAKKPAAKPDDQPEQKIQLVTPDFKPPRRVHDDGIELYRRIMDEAKARGDLVREEHAGRALGMLFESLIALDSIAEPSPRKRGLTVTTDEWGVSRLLIDRGIGAVEYRSADEGISYLVRRIAEVLGHAFVPSTSSDQVVRDVLGIDGRLPDNFEPAKKAVPLPGDERSEQNARGLGEPQFDVKGAENAAALERSARLAEEAPAVAVVKALLASLRAITGTTEASDGLKLKTYGAGDTVLNVPHLFSTYSLQPAEAVTYLVGEVVRLTGFKKPLSFVGGDVLYPSTDIMNTDDFAKQFAEVAPYLSEKQRVAILEKARHDARIGRFLAEINASDKKPMFKRDAPASLKMPDYLEREWFAKGWLRPDVDLQMVEAYEPGLPHLISTWERRNGILPEHLRFKKILNRTSEAERRAHIDKPDRRLGS